MSQQRDNTALEETYQEYLSKKGCEEIHRGWREFCSILSVIGNTYEFKGGSRKDLIEQLEKIPIPPQFEPGRMICFEERLKEFGVESFRNSANCWIKKVADLYLILKRDSWMLPDYDPKTSPYLFFEE
jgi:hypothetical protein